MANIVQPRTSDADKMTYSLENWADYVRGLGSTQTRQAMETHLASGTDDSLEDVHLLEDVRRLLREDARLDADVAPENDVVWTVKALPAVVAGSVARERTLLENTIPESTMPACFEDVYREQVRRIR